MNMAVLIVVFVFSLLVYLALTAGSGSLLLWSLGELVAGALFAVVAAIVADRLSRSIGIRPGLQWLNPVRWATFIAYVFGPFLLSLVKANMSVAWMVITGKIRPGIVRISPGLRTDFGTAMLANSITLTPGTMTVDVDDDRNLYVHWLYVKKMAPKAQDVCSSFPSWVRRISE